MVSRDPSSSNMVLMPSSMNPKSDVMVATRNTYYGNVNPMNGQDIDQPTSLAPPSSNPTPPMIPTELTIKPLKGVIHNSSFKPRVRVAKNYNTV